MNATNSYITETYYPKKGGGGGIKERKLKLYGPYAQKRLKCHLQVVFIHWSTINNRSINMRVLKKILQS